MSEIKKIYFLYRNCYSTSDTKLIGAYSSREKAVEVSIEEFRKQWNKVLKNESTNGWVCCEQFCIKETDYFE